MQNDGNRLCRLLARTLLTALLAATAMVSQAQGASNDLYRAEFVILERIVDPAAVDERMVNRQVEPPVSSGKTLYSVSREGSVSSSLKLVGRNQLHLGNAAKRLENSGKYRILMSAGWYEAFPPDYKGKPLRVELGDWLENAGQREVEGNITIDRQRYLHVAVHLNHWQESKVAASTITDGDSTEAAGTTATKSAELNLQPDVPLELLTWIRETRRMRSEEIHFLDSPTIGVLVFFKKVKPKQ